MADNQEQDRSEKPTQSKLDEARNKGQLAKSIEVSSIAAFLIMTAIWSIYADRISALITDTMNNSFIAIVAVNHVSSHSVMDAYKQLFFTLASVCMPILIMLMIAAIVFTILQNGWVWTTEPLRLDFERLNPIAGLKRLFTIATFFDAVKSILKLFVVGLFVYSSYESLLENVKTLKLINKSLFRHAIMADIEGFFIRLMIVLVFIALLDYRFVRWNYNRQMRMSKREVKDEYKKKEGDPEIRNKRRRFQQELMTKLIGLAEVRHADVVIINPTHIAIALKYDPDKMLAPKVVVAAKGFIAGKVRDIAVKNSVLIIQDIKLARMIYASSKTGEYISMDCFDAVSRIYRKLWRPVR